MRLPQPIGLRELTRKVAGADVVAGAMGSLERIVVAGAHRGRQAPPPLGGLMARSAWLEAKSRCAASAQGPPRSVRVSAPSRSVPMCGAAKRRRACGASAVHAASEVQAPRAHIGALGWLEPYREPSISHIRRKEHTSRLATDCCFVPARSHARVRALPTNEPENSKTGERTRSREPKCTTSRRGLS